MNNEIKYEKCPLCGKNCSIDETKCCRGKKFVRLLNEGEITEEKIAELKEQAKKREEFKNINKSGLIAIGLRSDDELIDVKITNGEKDILLVTENGMSIRFNETDIRPMGRTAMGVKGITLSTEDRVVSMNLTDEGHELLVVSENGFGKRTDINEYRVQSRAGKGIKTYNIFEKTGKIVGAEMVDEQDQIMIINSDGILIRLQVEDISIYGRVTSGVKLMKTEDEVNVVSIAKINIDEE